MPGTGARVKGMTLQERILGALQKTDGLTDAELASRFQVRHQAVNAACRTLQTKGVLLRASVNGVIRNTLCPNVCCNSSPRPNQADNSDGPLCEERLKEVLNGLLQTRGWRTEAAWGHSYVADIVAQRATTRRSSRSRGEARGTQ